MKTNILKYIFIDFVEFVLFIIGVTPAFLSFIFLPDIYYLNMIVGIVVVGLFYKFYSPWIEKCRTEFIYNSFFGFF